MSYLTHSFNSYCSGWMTHPFWMFIIIRNKTLFLNSVWVLFHTVKFFCEFINTLIKIFQWNMVSMIPFVANNVFICWFAMNCLVLIRKSITNNKKCNQYNYSPAVIKSMYFCMLIFYSVLTYRPARHTGITAMQFLSELCHFVL